MYVYIRMSVSGVCRLVLNRCYCPSILIIILFQRSFNEQLVMSIFHLCIIARKSSQKKDRHLSKSSSDKETMFYFVVKTED